MGSEMSAEQLNLERGDRITVSGTLDCQVYGGFVQILPEKVTLDARGYCICVII